VFAHDYPFDPTQGHDLAALLRIEAPQAPDDFVTFWLRLHAEARAITAAPVLHEVVSPRSRIRVFELTFSSLGGRSTGGWLTVPQDRPVQRGVVVGHGYGGRDGPDFHLPFEQAAMVFPCARGFSRSAGPDVPSDPMRHVLQGIASRESYVLAACAADTVWCAASALLTLYPAAAQRLDYLGISFGGGVGALALPWDERFHRAHLNVPSFGHHPLRLQCPCVGSGEAVRACQRRGRDVLPTLRYFDAATAAQHLRRPTLVAAALFDPAVPPPGQFAVYNALPGDKQLFVLQAGHFQHAGTALQDAQLLRALDGFFNCD
jgi:cephalosporin-C deacetylase